MAVDPPNDRDEREQSERGRSRGGRFRRWRSGWRLIALWTVGCAVVVGFVFWRDAHKTPVRHASAVGQQLGQFVPTPEFRRSIVPVANAMPPVNLAPPPPAPPPPQVRDAFGPPPGAPSRSEITGPRPPRMLTFTPGAFPRDRSQPEGAPQAGPNRTGAEAGKSTVAFKPTAIPGLKAGPAMDMTFTMMPGVVTCLLDNALDTTKPGKVFCHTDETVYSPLGVKLMEAGTRIVGDYQSDIGLGENRVGAVAGYAITPNGVPVPLGSFPMGDGLGRGGFDGELDTHPWARIGSALVLLTTQGAIGAAQTALQQRGSSYTNINVGGIDYALAEVIRNSANVRNTLRVNQGSRIGLLVAQPIDFSDAYALSETGR
ncbi:TrbI/VirB10 family protein [Novosphingopyxis sp.]|uniref:TrbI/VirB10 family protein n=1 Tax=Novosphingopyxis sp. TaxID=2709690 RepID=UPI003B5B649B